MGAISNAIAAAAVEKGAQAGPAPGLARTGLTPARISPGLPSRCHICAGTRGAAALESAQCAAARKRGARGVRASDLGGARAGQADVAVAAQSVLAARPCARACACADRMQRERPPHHVLDPRRAVAACDGRRAGVRHAPRVRCRPQRRHAVTLGRHLHRDCPNRDLGSPLCHIRTRTGLTPPTSAPGLRYHTFLELLPGLDMRGAARAEAPLPDEFVRHIRCGECARARMPTRSRARTRRTRACSSARAWLHKRARRRPPVRANREGARALRMHRAAQCGAAWRSLPAARRSAGAGGWVGRRTLGGSQGERAALADGGFRWVLAVGTQVRGLQLPVLQD